MPTPNSQLTSYQLIDFGRGRKLERFDGCILDRPCPAADGIQQASPKKWADANYRVIDKRWEPAESESIDGDENKAIYNEHESHDWLFRWHELSLSLKKSPFGHVGVFPEQTENWEWMKQLHDPSRGIVSNDAKPNALNLFAYTGGSTLALAASGFSVTHVDASKPSVQWARSNAENSQLSDAPIRWIVDDVRDFVQREIRRNHRYDFIALDPPAFGHGVNGKRWELQRDLRELVVDCCSLLTDRPIGVLLTGHSPIESMDWGPLDQPTFRRLSQRFRCCNSKRAGLIDLKGRELDCGYIFRWFN